MLKKLIKWHKNQAKLSLLPVLIVEWLIGLRIVENPLNKLHSLFTILYITIKFGIYNFLLSKVPRTIDCDRGLHSLLDSVIEFTVNYINAISVICSIAFGCYYSQVNITIKYIQMIAKKFINYKYYFKVTSNCIQRLNKVDKTLREIGAIIKYSKQFYKCIFCLLLWLLTIICSGLMDLYFFCPRRSFLISIFVNFLYNYSAHITSIIFLSFISMIK